MVPLNGLYGSSHRRHAQHDKKTRNGSYTSSILINNENFTIEEEDNTLTASSTKRFMS